MSEIATHTHILTDETTTPEHRYVEGPTPLLDKSKASRSCASLFFCLSVVILRLIVVSLFSRFVSLYCNFVSP